MLGLKEIYHLIIKATYDIEVQGRKIKAGEPIVMFDRLQMANFQELTRRVDARGGIGNISRITWESTEEVRLLFTQGVFSRLHFAIMGNSNLKKISTFEAPKEEVKIELNEFGRVDLAQLPLTTPYVYNSRTGEPLTCQMIGQTLFCDGVDPYTEVDAFYDFETSGATVLEVGKRLLNGYVSLQAKTRLKDDRSGKVVTGIFKIPKAKLVSDFSIRLGANIPPGIGNFSVSAIPTGSKGSEKVMDFIILNDDIDSDI